MGEMIDHLEGMNVVSLGIQSMPDGYSLVLNADGTHYYGVRRDGMESCEHWDKWAVYRGAKNDYADPCGGLSKSKIESGVSDE